MLKIAFMGAGSTAFAKNIIGDCMLTPALCEAEFALHDIDLQRLNDSAKILETINRNCNGGKAKISTYPVRKDALRGAKYVVNAIQVGGYEPATVIDFEIPKKYGLRQTIGDTLGIGGIFRGLRTIPVILDFLRDTEEVCPDAYFLNYTNPMAMITGAMQKASPIKSVGLCHSVQVCASGLMQNLEMPEDNLVYKIAGINHMAWLLEVSRNGVDLYPEIRKRAKNIDKKHHNRLRIELINRLGYYVTESSEHNAEYSSLFIKSNYPELIEEFSIPLDEYPRRCVDQIEKLTKMVEELKVKEDLTHEMSNEYGSRIINAIETDTPYKIGGNVLNKGYITNLPYDACVEVPCLVDGSGITPCYVGALPPQLAAFNQTNINVQTLTIEAALTLKREHIYHAAMLGPHTSAELSIDDIYHLCDELIEAHGDYLPKYK